MKKLLLLALVVFLAGCTTQKEAELSDNVVTIENYFVNPVAPYERNPVTMQFDVKNNGDQTIPYLEVDFFDLPGFRIIDKTDIKTVTEHDKTKETVSTLIETGLDCGIGARKGIESKCVFTNFEPFEVSTISIKLISTYDVSSPTPQTASFAVRYVYLGSREISVPVIDDSTRKQPLTKSRESPASVGPVVLDIEPSLDRQISADGKSATEWWAVGGKNPLPFIVKFKFDHIGSIKEKVTDINISVGSFRLHVNGLDAQQPCNDFCFKSEGGCLANIDSSDRLATFTGTYVANLGPKYYKYNPDISNGELYSTKSPRMSTDVFICTFKPNKQNPEYSATIEGNFVYKYEYIKKQDFVIQPLPT